MLHPPVELAGSSGHNLEPGQYERKRFTQVSDHELQFRELIEHSAENHAKDMKRSFDLPAPTGPANVSDQVGENPLYDASITGCGGGVE